MFGACLEYQVDALDLRSMATPATPNALQAGGGAVSGRTALNICHKP
jgi:hypothetical protein